MTAPERQPEACPVEQVERLAHGPADQPVPEDLCLHLEQCAACRARLGEANTSFHSRTTVSSSRTRADSTSSLLRRQRTMSCTSRDRAYRFLKGVAWCGSCELEREAG